MPARSMSPSRPPRRRSAWRLPRLPVLAIATLSLTGCASTAYRACPSLVGYSPEFQDRLADQLPSLPPEAVTALTDYARLRDQVRACQGD